MRLDRLSVQDYRNIAKAELSPAPELTVLVGQNGQGKTNLLESIWMLTGGKSFRGSRDAELVRRNAEFAVLEGTVQAQQRQQNIRIAVGLPGSQRPGRTAKVNGADRGRAASIAGTFTAVVFDPGHLSLIKGSPDGRRRFLDAALCQLYPGYLSVVRRCLRVTSQKNALLKKYDSTPGASEFLDVLNEELVRTGGEITRRRMEYLQALLPLAEANYRDISQGAESLQLAYKPCFENSLAEKLQSVRSREIAAGFCLAGPHREDFEVYLSGEPAKLYGSQGQQRSAVLSLKLAEAARAQQVTGEHPVMLLDDVLSELDDSRQTYLLTRMQGKQTFVTSCDSAAFARTNGKLVLVQQGEIRELN